MQDRAQDEGVSVFLAGVHEATCKEGEVCI